MKNTIWLILALTLFGCSSEVKNWEKTEYKSVITKKSNFKRYGGECGWGKYEYTLKDGLFIEGNGVDSKIGDTLIYSWTTYKEWSNDNGCWIEKADCEFIGIISNGRPK